MQSDNDEKTLLLTSSRLFDAYRGGDDDRRGEADEDIYDFCAAWVGRLVEISMGGEAETSAGVGDHSYAARLAREVASARGAPKELTRLPFEFGSKKKKFAKGRNTHAGVKRSRPERVEPWGGALSGTAIPFTRAAMHRSRTLAVALAMCDARNQFQAEGGERSHAAPLLRVSRGTRRLSTARVVALSPDLRSCVLEPARDLGSDSVGESASASAGRVSGAEHGSPEQARESERGRGVGGGSLGGGGSVMEVLAANGGRRITLRTKSLVGVERRLTREQLRALVREAAGECGGGGGVCDGEGRGTASTEEKVTEVAEGSGNGTSEQPNSSRLDPAVLSAAALALSTGMADAGETRKRRQDPSRGFGVLGGAIGGGKGSENGKRRKIESDKSADGSSSSSSSSVGANKGKKSSNPHDGTVDDKYWAQRYRLFSRFDEGVRMDPEGWFSVAPEKISAHVARRCWAGLSSAAAAAAAGGGAGGGATTATATPSRPTPCGLLIYDAFCGCGGSAIQFALAGFRVLATDIDPVKLACARHNAAIYGVLGRIEFVLCDCRKMMEGQGTGLDAVCAIHLAPPWGGPSYIANADAADSHSVSALITDPCDGAELFRAATAVTANVVYSLPRNVDAKSVGDLARPVEVERNYINGKLKTVTAYFGCMVGENK